MHLVQDLVVEVLVWLPAETLIKFRCVSKSWRALIDSTQFKQLHLRRIRSWTSAEEQNKFLFGLSDWLDLTRRKSRHYVVEFGSLDKMPKKPMWELHCPFKLDMMIKNPKWEFLCHLNLTYGSCNGLICLGHYDRSTRDHSTHVILWNPCINKYWKLPFYPLHGPEPESDYAICGYGFGYDDIADDYKVVRRVELNDDDDDDDDDDDPIETQICQEVIVYSLKSNSWTSLPQFPYSHLHHGRNRAINGINVNCALHWILMDNLHCDVAIWALDLRTDKCHSISLPLETEGEKFSRLLALDGCLCVVPAHKSGKPFWDLWIMKNYGVKDSWTKLTIQLSTFPGDPCNVPCVLYGVAYSQRSTELVLCGRRGVMWYNTEKGDWVLASMRGGDIQDGFHQFIGSLIDPSPCGGNGISGENSGIKRVEANLLMQMGEQIKQHQWLMQMGEQIKQQWQY